MDLTTIKFKKVEYVECSQILEKAPIYSKGSRNTRTLVKKKEIPEDMYMFAKQNEEGKWIKTSGDSIKFDKILLKKEFLLNIPELQEKNDETPIEKGILEAPEIVELTDDEKFKDVAGNIIEIEARGTRDSKGIIFKLKDAEKGFGIKKLQTVLTNKGSSYTKNIDYKYFNCHTAMEDGKIQIKKFMYLTYCGILKVLFTTKSGKTEGFIEWATETLFTVQMGTKDQKETLVEGILGMSMDSLKVALAASTSDVSCIYRFALGTAKELRKVMSIPDHIPDNYIIIKYGFTKDLSERMMRHIETFSKIKGTRLELMNYVFIDPKYLSRAEVDIKEFYMTIEKKIDFKIKYVVKSKTKSKKGDEDDEEYDESKNFKELVAIDPKHEKEIIKQHKYIGSQYSGRVQVLTDTINALQREVEKERKEKDNIEKMCKLELENERKEKINLEKMCKSEIKAVEAQFKIKEEQFKTKEEQFKNQLLTKEIEYLKLSLSFQAKK